MPTPEELMKVVAGGAGMKPQGAPTGGGAAPGASPTGAPMTTPQPNEGAQEASMIDIAMALDLLERSMGNFGSESEEGQSIMKALSSLTKTFGAKRDSAKPMIPAEIMQLVSTLGKNSPEMAAMMGGGGQPGGQSQGGGMPQPQQMAG